MKKRITALLLIAAALLSLCACRDQKTIDSMVAFINGKYPGYDFKFHSVYGPVFSEEVYDVYVTTDAYPDRLIRVTTRFANDSEPGYSDNFLGLYYEEQTATYLRNQLEQEYGGPVYLSYTAPEYGHTKGSLRDTTFEEYIAQTDSAIEITAAVCAEITSEEEAIDRLEKTFSDAAIRGNICFFEPGTDLTYYYEVESLIDAMEYDKRMHWYSGGMGVIKHVTWVEGLGIGGKDQSEPGVAVHPDLVTGEVLTFGSYEQDGNEENGPEPIEWYVMEDAFGGQLLLSKYALDVGSYTNGMGTTWERSLLAQWLNTTFYATAFTAQERQQITTASVSTEEEVYEPTSLIFTPSPGEAKMYGQYLQQVYECYPTDYALSQGLTVSEAGTVSWWLRDGTVCGETAGERAEPQVSYGIRPVLWRVKDE